MKPGAKRKRFSRRLTKERLVDELIQEFYLPGARVGLRLTGFLRSFKAEANQTRVSVKRKKL